MSYISCIREPGNASVINLLKRANLKRLCAGTNKLRDTAIYSLQDIVDINIETIDKTKCDDICKYIIYSSISHFYDAWEYAGCAIDSLLKQHNPMAIHFAYYAELRAMSSILASSGVAAQSSKRLMTITVDGTQDKILHGRGDIHKLWNDINDKWFKINNNAVSLFNYTNLGQDISISTFLEEINHTNAISIQVSDFIENILGCLKTASENRKLRNARSYKPQTLINEVNTRLPIESDYKRAILLLKTCESWMANDIIFQSLDRSILIYIINTIIEAKIAAGDNAKDLIKNIDLLLEKYKIPFIKNNNKYKHNNNSMNDEIIKLSMLKSDTPIEVIANSILLIRISELALRKLFNKNKLNIKILENYLISLVKSIEFDLCDLLGDSPMSYDEKIEEIKNEDLLVDLLVPTKRYMDCIDLDNFSGASNIYEDISLCSKNENLTEHDKTSYLEALLLSHSIERIGIASLYKIS